MGKFCGDFKIKKLFGFPLEYERDPLTNKSEVETLEELANKMGYSVARYIREAVLAYNAKNEHMLSRNPKLDQFIGERKPEDYIPMEPTLADYLSVHVEFMRKSITSKDEARRREQKCKSLQREYYLLGEDLEEKEIEEARQSTIKREQLFKNEELGIGIEK